MMREREGGREGFDSVNDGDVNLVATSKYASEYIQFISKKIKVSPKMGICAIVRVIGCSSPLSYIYVYSKYFRRFRICKALNKFLQFYIARGIVLKRSHDSGYMA